MTKFQTYYFDSAVFDLAKVIEDAQQELTEIEFDTMIGTGFSGGIVIPTLALRMDKKFVLIRKEGDDSHHGKGRLLGELGKRWIFVDDFISSGSTRTRVIQKIADAEEGYSYRRVETTFVGQYMYSRINDPVFEPFDERWVRP